MIVGSSPILALPLAIDAERLLTWICFPAGTHGISSCAQRAHAEGVPLCEQQGCCQSTGTRGGILLRCLQGRPSERDGVSERELRYETSLPQPFTSMQWSIFQEAVGICHQLFLQQQAEDSRDHLRVHCMQINTSDMLCPVSCLHAHLQHSVCRSCQHRSAIPFTELCVS